MSWFQPPATYDRLTASTNGEPGSPGRSGPQGQAVMALSMDDPYLADFMRDGAPSVSGATVNVETALRNPTIYRAMSLISYAVGMLPLQVINEDTKEKATDHELYRLLHREPNNWQTAFDFRTLMQLRLLLHGDAYAYVVRSRDIRTGRSKIVRLVPFDVGTITPQQSDDWSVTYRYQPKNGGERILQPTDVFHLRALSLNGLTGMSLVRQASNAIGLALSAELASGRLLKNGAFVSGALKHPNQLGDTAYNRLRESLADREGAENAGKSLILEEGMDWVSISANARDSQMIELRKHQVEECSRVTGVPRPLLMVDDTSWGSGIGELGRFFVTYGLNPHFVSWEQAIERMMPDEDKGRYAAKFNAGALLRGSMKDQADWFSKALGMGGGKPWAKQNEVRDMLDWPADAALSSNELGAANSITPTKAAPGGKEIDDAA